MTEKPNNEFLKKLVNGEPLLLMFEKTIKRFYRDSVIPAEAGIQLKTPGFRVKPEMTKVKLYF
jgi:hypothetical protein